MPKIPKIAKDKIANEMYEAAARQEKKSRNYLGMSEIGKACGRAIWYNFRGFTPKEKEGRLLMLFRFGDRIEEEVIYHLTLAGYKVEGQQDYFEDMNGFFRGHCDGVIHGVTSRPHILEVKSANDKKFKMFQKKGVKAVYPVYYLQCQCYMGYAGLDRALVIVQNKNNSELYTERIYFHKADFSAIKERAKMIISANEPPAKLMNNKFECDWCDHRINCQYPEQRILKEKTCGTCYYLQFKGTRPYCCNPDHTFEIQRWGECCPDWILFDTKEPIDKKRIKIK